MRGRPGTRRGSKSAKKSTRSKTARTKTGRAATKKAKAPAKKAKAPAKKTPAKKKPVRKAAAAPARKKPTARKPAAKKTVAKRSTKRTPRSARKEVFGEGNYTASREFRDQQTDFVRRNRNRIESPGEEAEAALEGNEGPKLEEAEEEARSHSHSPDDEG
jgi:hypothetical protein